MSKPPSGDPPRGPPIGAFFYPLTGSIRGSVGVDPGGTYLNIDATSSKNEWDQNYRVLGTLDAASQPAVLRCRVYPEHKFRPETETILGRAAPPAAGQML